MKVYAKKKKNKNQNKAGFRLQRFFFPKWPYLTGPSKGYEKETSLRDSI